MENYQQGSFNKKALICSKIISLFQNSESSKQRGNLFLSGIEGLKKTIISEFEISAVLTVMNEWSFNYNNISNKIKLNKNIKTHKWIDLHDHQDESIYPHFDIAIQFIKQNLQKGNVLIHCLMGVSRSASIVLAYLMKEKKMSLTQAFQYTTKIRNIVQPNESFWKDLINFQKNLLFQGEKQSETQQI